MRHAAPVCSTWTARRRESYSYDSHNRLAAVVEERPTQTRYTYSDHLGTPFLQTDTAFAPVWRIEYEPFGSAYELRTGTNPDQRLRFPGQEYDEQTPEREYNIFRWYRSWWGRYTQADPAGLRGDLNLYRYADDSPLVVADRLALQGVLYQIQYPDNILPKDCESATLWAYGDRLPDVPEGVQLEAH